MQSAPDEMNQAVFASTCCAASRIRTPTYFFEVSLDEAKVEAHRAAADTLDGPAQVTRCDPVFPAAEEYWEKCRSPV